MNVRLLDSMALTANDMLCGAGRPAWAGYQRQCHNGGMSLLHSSSHSLCHAEQATQQAAEKKVRGTKRKLTVRERLARKLLSGRSVGKAQEEQGAVEDEQIRDRTANAF